jgi:hypothetical protein
MPDSDFDCYPSSSVSTSAIEASEMEADIPAAQLSFFPFFSPFFSPFGFGFGFQPWRRFWW